MGLVSAGSGGIMAVFLALKLDGQCFLCIRRLPPLLTLVVPGASFCNGHPSCPVCQFNAGTAIKVEPSEGSDFGIQLEIPQTLQILALWLGHTCWISLTVFAHEIPWTVSIPERCNLMAR